MQSVSIALNVTQCHRWIVSKTANFLSKIANFQASPEFTLPAVKSDPSEISVRFRVVRNK